MMLSNLTISFRHHNTPQSIFFFFIFFGHEQYNMVLSKRHCAQKLARHADLSSNLRWFCKKRHGKFCTHICFLLLLGCTATLSATPCGPMRSSCNINGLASLSTSVLKKRCNHRAVALSNSVLCREGAEPHFSTTEAAIISLAYLGWEMKSIYYARPRVFVNIYPRVEQRARARTVYLSPKSRECFSRMTFDHRVCFGKRILQRTGQRPVSSRHLFFLPCAVVFRNGAFLSQDVFDGAYAFFEYCFLIVSIGY